MSQIPESAQPDRCILAQNVITAAVNRPGQFSFDNGIAITQARKDYAEGVLTVQPSSYNPNGTVHGGCLFTLADTVAGVAACSRGASCVTVNSSMEFLRPATGARITCTASPKKAGRTLSVIQVTLSNEHGKTVATGTFTFFLSELEKG